MFRVLLSAAVFVAGLWAQSPPVTLEKGRVIPKVVCSAKPEQSYALYLPKAYDPVKKWPVLFIFEPSANGPLPVRIMKDVAEKYGYIVLSSNNSRNGPWQPQMDAADAMWQEARVRFALDPKRVYFAGFSGGARVSIALAAACKGCAAGVFASGAAFPLGLDPKSTSGFALFAAIGYEDFNYPEIFLLEPKLQEARFTYHVRRFDGAHQWAPAEVWDEALAWFNLQAMRSGALLKEDAFVRDAYQFSLTQASELATSGKEYDSFRRYDQLLRDFSGLTDTSVAQQRIAELQKSKAVKKGVSAEKEAVEQQVRMADPINTIIQSVAEGRSLTVDQRDELSRLFSEVRRRAKNDQDPQQLVAKRALAQEFVRAFESGAHMIDAKEYSRALSMYEVITQNALKAPGAHLQRARAYAALGNKSKALEELRAAIQDGITGSESLDQPEFATLQNDPGFQSISASLHQTNAE